MTRILSVLVVCLAVASCGGASPTSPDFGSNIPAPTSTTAVIAGTVAGAMSPALFSTNGAGAGLTVTIEGTNITATVNGAGQFVLTGVAPGTITLRFNGVGANATLSIGVVSAGQTVTITVVVNGNTAELQEQEKTLGSDREIEGRIESIQGSTLKVAGRTVTVGGSTVIRHGDTTMTLAQLEVGQRVHVKGTVTGTGATAVTAATLILVQNVDTSGKVNLQGTVSGLTGTAGAFEFVVDGRPVKGTAATEFKGGQSPSFTGLANGGKVHVKGSQQNGFVQAESVTLQGGN